MERKCIGCGVLLQSNDENKEGFLPANKIEKSGNLYCQRCFRLTHYHEIPPIREVDAHKIINQIANEKALIINVVDLFDFSATFNVSIQRITNQEDMIIVGNRFDLLPHSIKEHKLKNWVFHMAKLEGLKVLDVIITSGKSVFNIDELVEKIIKYKRNRKVYFLGCVNVGKSTLINAIIKRYTNETKDIITVSKMPGTTLDLIEIKLDNFFIIDTPGIMNQYQITNFLSQESINILMPKAEIKPTILQLKSSQTVFIGGLAILDYVKGINTSFVFYFSNEIIIHRTKTINKQAFYEKHCFNLLTPPFKDEISDLKFTNHQLKIKDDGKKYDIAISGLGFISVKGDLEINLEVIRNTGVYIREAII